MSRLLTHMSLIFSPLFKAIAVVNAELKALEDLKANCSWLMLFLWDPSNSFVVEKELQVLVI